MVSVTKPKYVGGHRRSYVACGPGIIVQVLVHVLTLSFFSTNLTELDKVISMEILPLRFYKSWILNKTGVSINVAIDLSQVLFICTANSLDTIPPPLLDRCEIVQVAGYMFDEKVAIANRFLVPKQIGMNGLQKQYVEMSEETLREIVTGWTREARVRSLERAIVGVVRFKAVEWAEWVEKCESDGKVGYVPSSEELESIVNDHAVQSNCPPL